MTRSSLCEFSKRIEKKYEQYRESAIQKHRFRHRDIVPLVEKFSGNSIFSVREAGKSFENRSIYSLRTGKGNRKVMLWSQMHGNESSATMAIFDICNFLAANDEFEELRSQILNKLNICFIPMLNPDGAEVFKRVNAQYIDINRDTLRLQSPEAKLLKLMLDRFNPDFGFNLHDQDRHYSAGKSSNPASMSFLAPAFNHERTIDKLRENSMKVIAAMNHVLQQFIPAQVAKYSDAYNLQCFGDFIQKSGTSTILIESGNSINDSEKQYIRKLTFISILSALFSIAENSFEKFEINEYYQIPENVKDFYDLIIRNAQIEKNGTKYTIDIAINNEGLDFADHKTPDYKSIINNIGDLSNFFAYNDFDANGMLLVPCQYSLEKKKIMANTTLVLEGEANFVLQENENPKYAVIDGFLHNL
jgi:hypothetical protein